jgi:hypothetical protein
MDLEIVPMLSVDREGISVGITIEDAYAYPDATESAKSLQP